MKKLLALSILASVLLIVSISAVSACTSKDPTCKDSVIITGTIYSGDNINNFVANAIVNVTCDHKKGNNITHTNLQTTSNSIGSYTVYFDDKYCRKGDTVTVSAKNANGDMLGENKGVVLKEKINKIKCRIAHIDVSMIPEFGTTVGILTALGAVGTFFLVRRK